MTTREQVKPVWKCRVEGCGYTAAPTEEGYRKVTGHQLAHASMPKGEKGYCLIDENTGEILAEKLAEAVEKGFIKAEPPKATSPKPGEQEPKPGEQEPKPTKEEPVPVKAEEKVEEKPEEKEEDEEKKGEKEITTPQVSSEGIFKYTISLPADAFVLFNIAKAYGLETDGDKPFEEWLWDCIQKRYELDYKRRLVLAPLEV